METSCDNHDVSSESLELLVAGEEDRVLTHFLATTLVTDTSNLGTPKLYVLCEDSVETFDPKDTSKYDRVVGLAYALLNQTRLNHLRFWFCPAQWRQQRAYLDRGGSR
ncbi:hypothetical protein Ae201684P_020830 [Aphanomyces euteiches]|nr:hypothetical protein Ae201684P_020830 [Aphanomyces euteiches]